MELIVRASRCIHCEACRYLCQKGALTLTKAGPVIDRERCDACGECIDDCYTGALELAGREMTVAQVMEEVLRDRLFFEQSQGGVTFSGGEPIRQGEFLYHLLMGCKQAGLHTAVDTCGYARWETYERILPYTDLFLYDFKVADPDLHRLHTGVSNDLILSNLRRLSSMGKRIFIRIPVIPGINDSEDNLRETGEILASLPGLELIELLPYHASAESKYEGLGMQFGLPDVQPPLPEQMESFAGVLRDYGLVVKFG